MSAATDSRPNTAAGPAVTMRAAVRTSYGGPDAVEIREVEKPEVGEDNVLVRVRAASLNRIDWYTLTGTPYLGRTQMGLLKPKTDRLGVDFAGTVEAVGKDVTGFKIGDEVFGGRSGSLAEYLTARDAVALKPSNVTFEEAATVGVAGLTALQGLRDKAQVQPGQKVLVNGASGGVGTFAVQVAKVLGADVTAVCSTRNVELVRSLGADRVIDYTRDDFTRSGERYDVVFDVAGGRSWRELKRVLKRDAAVVIAGAGKGGRALGPIPHIGALRVGSMLGSQNAIFFIAKLERPDLQFFAELLEAGKVKPVVERTYELDDVADALRYVGEGHTQGKIVVTV